MRPQLPDAPPRRSPATVGSSRGIDLALLETVLVHLPVAVSVLDADLRFVLVNKRAADINGRTPAEHVGRRVADLLPGIPASIGAVVRRVLATGEPAVDVDIVGPTPARPGARRWRGSYYPVYGAAAAAPTSVAVIFDEVDSPDAPVGVGELAADRATSLAVLDTLIDNAPVGIAVLDTELRYLRINPILAAWNEKPVAAHLGRRLREVLPQVADLLEGVLNEVAATGRTVRDMEMSYADRSWLSSYFAVPGASGEIAALAILVTDVTARRRGEQRARRLQRFTAALAQALTVDDVVEAVVSTGVRAAGADVAGVALLDERGTRIDFVPSTAASGEPPARWVGVDRDADHPVAEALRTGRPIFFPDPQALISRYPDLAATRDQTGDHAIAVIPLRGRGTAAGVLTFAFHREQPFEVEHRDVLTAVAGLAGQALARAQLYQREHETAVRLQRSLLPTRLPHVPGVDIAAAYVTGDAAEVGGDFYDVFPVRAETDAEWVAVIGDVAGRGVNAASVTGLARHTLRITAAQAPPAEALRALHERLTADPDVDRFVTVACARLRLREGAATLDLASGGHPPALVRRADGHVDVISVRGVILGAFPEVRLGQRTVDLCPGDTLVLYTDGVIEARGPEGLFGQERLVSLLQDLPGGDPSLVVGRIREEVAAYQRGPQADDLAVLALRLTG
ncbi:SpoIIE family protein phosphatase [Micromonospora sp. NPDC049799]|uniref:SpoIIE family protein phosphatase n=1 Tax=Micromonospora sp. NPDC049799 TaxID=3154741 RepID=UPI0033EA78E7